MPKGYPKNAELARHRRSESHKKRIRSDSWYENVRKMLIKRNKSKVHIKKVRLANTGVKFTEERKLKIKLNRPDFNGNKNPRWLGGNFISRGYRFIYSPKHPLRNIKGYVREHLFILYKHLSGNIKKSNVIHHIDKNKLNNNINNLMVMKDHGAHRRIHCNRTKIGDILFDGSKE